jgi:uncharacterized protein
MDLTARTALVTGASRGIGRAVIEELARRPLKLVLAGVRDLETFEPVVPPPGGATEVRPVHVDLSSREAIDASADALGDQLADVDVLVNNAGQFTAGLLEEQDMADVYALMQVNLVAVAHLTHRVLPAMLRRGSGLIVNNTSIVGYAHMPAATTYAASKAGVVGLSESLRRELKGTGVGRPARRHAGRGDRHAGQDRRPLRPLRRHVALGPHRAERMGAARRPGDRAR